MKKIIPVFDNDPSIFGLEKTATNPYNHKPIYSRLLYEDRAEEKKVEILVNGIGYSNPNNIDIMIEGRFDGDEAINMAVLSSILRYAVHTPVKEDD